ncbi:21568_t:CDS:2 [Entrophospora sp. SA101]|nr:5414_t:CDS:2 [Entrophospora sp. SA101]CAJ0640085.1 4931_t:CDS:2 [Entrophospora sp. SA101]CAJ0753457.1 21568_t:CDS:2 [Entrophospora sp. SA101]CAJ0835978.1 1812_t:CDS:2 [Entrophospora sp. SA101]CAJ0836948.1 3370_t:CDS:2 [Entrophospora sp. SA101]
MPFFEEIFEILPYNFIKPIKLPPWFINGDNFNQKFVPINVSTTSTDYIIRAILPGITINQLSIDITNDDILTISGEHKKKSDNDEEKPLIVETMGIEGSFTRSIKFPKDSIDIDNIKAEFNNGELIIKVPKKTSSDTR